MIGTRKLVFFDEVSRIKAPGDECRRNQVGDPSNVLMGRGGTPLGNYRPDTGGPGDECRRNQVRGPHQRVDGERRNASW
jgi:hypothetical protein